MDFEKIQVELQKKDIDSYLYNEPQKINEKLKSNENLKSEK